MIGMTIGPWVGEGSLTIEGETYSVSYDIRFRVENKRHVFDGKASGLPNKVRGLPSPVRDRLPLTLADGKVVHVALIDPLTGAIAVNERMPGFG
jgi:hypothetical protein